jgi:hypothetical protein
MTRVKVSGGYEKDDKPNNDGEKDVANIIALEAKIKR